MTPVCIIGLGSALGADQAGWLVAQRLEELKFSQRFPDGVVSVARCASPAELPGLISSARLAIMIDALDVNADQQPLRRLEMEELQSHSQSFSSHGLDIINALELAQLLAPQPLEIVLYGLALKKSLDEHPLYNPFSEVRTLLPDLYRTLEDDVRKFLSANPP